ncbi:hypothetical protein P676_2240 [Acinetobacter baumannii UH7607]|nr:hypothetical protein [Acinetobacter baumannii]ETR11608.1 hypothetical protein P676_2240 [Acinetobacter baumannii UH7607]
MRNSLLSKRLKRTEIRLLIIRPLAKVVIASSSDLPVQRLS